MALKITVPDRKNTGAEMTYFNIDTIEIRHRSERKEVHIKLGGYLDEAKFNAGNNPLETKTVIVPFDEPDDGDEFTTLRGAVKTKIAAFIADAQKLVLKTDAWKEAEPV